MSRPRIGIPVDLDEGAGRHEIGRGYADAVLQAGGLPILLPPAPEAARDYLAACDGLLVAGGAFDIAPERYGETRRAARLGPTRPARTDFEWAMAEAALGAGVPVLGVCGGMQLLNVVRGGTLHQHLPDDLGADHEQAAPKDVPSHLVEIEPGTLLARLVGEEPLPVNSTHHQAVSRPGAGVRVSARAPDGVVEALEVPGLPFALGVQWHPEAAGRHEPRHLAIYRGLVDAARGGRR